MKLRGKHPVFNISRHDEGASLANVLFGGRYSGSFDGYVDDGYVKYNFQSAAANLAFDPRVSFSRSTSALYYDGGVVKVAPIDTPRMSQPSIVDGGESYGMLIEGGATNQCLWSRDLTNAAWTKSNITPVLDQIGVDGTSSSATKLTASAANGTVTQAITDASNVARTFSLFVKRLTGTGNIDITLDNGTGWTTVTVTAGWTRVAKTQNLTNPTIGIRIVTSGDAIAVDICQEEEFAVATSPIITTTVGVARSQDIAIVYGDQFLEGFNSSQGTWIATYRVDTSDISGVERNAISVDDNTTNERFALLQDNGSNAARFSVTDGNVSQAALIGGDPAIATIHKLGGSYAVNDFKGSLDGSDPANDTGGTLPTVTQIRFGGRYNSTTSQLYGLVYALEYYNTSSSDAVLATRTT